MPVSRVVVGIGDRPTSERVAAWALQEAAALGAHLVLVRAGVPAESTELGAVARGDWPDLAGVDPVLADAVAAARAVLGLERVMVVVDRDSPDSVLVGTARPGDLLAVGPPQRAGWWARASTTYHVTTRAPCPVVVVHEPSPPPPGEGLFRSHVVVGVDGSPQARAALGFGFEYAARRDLPLVAANVTAHTDTDVWFDDTLLETHLTKDPQAAVLLATETEPWHLKYPSVAHKRALVAGHPAEALRRVAAGAALLAVGSAGTGLALLGSASRALAERATCPVAVVPAAG